MKIAYSARHQLHDPQFFLVRGKAQRSAEQPERATRLLDAIRPLDVEIHEPADFGPGPRAAIHTPAYLDFLETAHARWQALGDSSPEVLPNVHPLPGQPVTYPEGIVGRAGYHMADTACPIGAGTWAAAVEAAHSAAQAAQWVIDGERATYALCRPPGHHAYADRAGGFCFLNNSAIAAQYLLPKFGRVAILDVDVHHGNGTQGIFWHRRDVLTISLHGDPSSFYPFYVGHAHERGEGDGLGYNINVPLAHGTGDDGYMTALAGAARQLKAFAPGAVVVALGLDAYEGDPLKALAITTPGFARIGAAIAELGLPTVFVQEGGYLSAELGPNLASVLTGFRRAA
jgi:acetoin utilization deacetylase AcuC-like enzyme